MSFMDNTSICIYIIIEGQVVLMVVIPLSVFT